MKQLLESIQSNIQKQLHENDLNLLADIDDDINLDGEITKKNINYNPQYKPIKFVDLGLPSGNLWAECNIGANEPWEYGDYFAWAEIAPKKVFSWKTYKYRLDTPLDDTESSKYTCMDDLTTLEQPDDAAAQILGKKWRIPSKSDFDELLKQPKTIINNYGGLGKKGVAILGNTGQVLFIPLTGIMESRGPREQEYNAALWTNEADVYEDDFACAFSYYASFHEHSYYKYVGLNIRAIQKK